MNRHETEAELFGALFVLGQHLTRHADEALTPYGVTSRQWLLLAVLVRAFPGTQPTLSEAAAVYGTSRQNVKMIANQLAARRLVELRPDPADRRAVRLAVTGRVAELFDTPEASAQQQGIVGAVFAGLTSDEVATFSRLVTRCIDTLKSSGAVAEVRK